MTELLYGTSSWSEKTWEGTFYPPGVRPAAYLEWYASKFRTVEADVTYYRIPTESMIEGWDRKTPDGFVLSAKFPRSIVHAGDGSRPNATRLLLPEHVGEDTEEFLGVMSGLGQKCGPLVLQFPYFNQTVFGEAGPFLQRLDTYLGSLPKTFRYAVEVRNKWWIRPPLLDLLRRHDVALVLVEIAYMPHPDDLMKREDLITTDFLYGRLIGDRKALDAITKSFDKIYVDRSYGLRKWASVLQAALGRVQRGYVYANNHYAGHAPDTIRELMRLLQEAKDGPV